VCYVVPSGVQGLISQELTRAMEHKDKSEKKEEKKEKKGAKIKEVIS